MKAMSGPYKEALIELARRVKDTIKRRAWQELDAL